MMKDKTSCHAAIKMKLSPHVVKFLNVHLKRSNVIDGLCISTRSPIGRRFMAMVRRAPNGYKYEDDFNITMVISFGKKMYEYYPFDLRVHSVYIPNSAICRLDKTLNRFILKYCAFWIYKKSIETPDITEKEALDQFRNIYNITEDELPFEKFHMHYWRFRKEFETPEKYIFKMLDVMYSNIKKHL